MTGDFRPAAGLGGDGHCGSRVVARTPTAPSRPVFARSATAASDAAGHAHTKDLTGRECKSWWCRKHIQFIERTPFCPRHASVIRALAPTANTIFEIKNRPAVDDRALPLAALVAEDVDKDVTELVRRRYQNRKDVTLARDRTVRQTWSGRNEVAWERSWSALKSQGYLVRIAVRVTTAEPDMVQLLIGNTVVFKEVPDWISRRREGEPPDHADRARFGKKLFGAILEHVDQPQPLPAIAIPSNGQEIEPPPPPEINRTLIEGMVLRLASAATRLTGFEVADHLALPFGAVEPILKALTGSNHLDALGLAPEQGPWLGRPLPERMAYALTKQGRIRSDEIAGASTRYAGPAPVSLAEYRQVLAEAAKPATLDLTKVTMALSGIELAPGVVEAVRAAVNSRSSIFIYGAPGNGKTTLARRIPALLGGPIVIPVALDIGGGEVMTIFDGSVHRLEQHQPADKRWRRIARPLVQVGGEFQLDMFDPTFEEGSRTYGAPLQVKANGGVLLIDDLGRQRVSPKQILDRLLVPLEQEIDYMNLTASGRKVEVPFWAQLALVHQPEAGRAARRGLPAPPLLQGVDARSHVGDVVSDLRARAGPADHSARSPGAGGDPQPLQRPAAARQPPARPARATRGRLRRPRRAPSAHPRAGRGGLAHAVHHELEDRITGPRYTLASPRKRRWRNGRRASFRS